VRFGGSRILEAQPNPKYLSERFISWNRYEGIRDHADCRTTLGEASRASSFCVRNEGYPVGLELRKVYRVLADEQASTRHQLRVIDESGEDYLYPEEHFVFVG
jgi:hypothetical protein